jgi:enoyl-CoA hydratase
MTVRSERRPPVVVITIDRPDVANAIDQPTATALVAAFTQFDDDDDLSVAVLTGAGGTFCAGADLKAMRARDPERVTRIEPGVSRASLRASERRRSGDGPVGPTRMMLSKPVIAAVEGHAVAGGLELAAWCDLRVATDDAVFGVFCRRWSIPLMDGGTIRLARLIGHSHALDLILTGRGVPADEALRMGLANRVVPTGTALQHAVDLALDIASHPQAALRTDRRSSYDQWGLPLDAALAREYDLGVDVLRTGEITGGLDRYASGAWRSPGPTSR